MSADDGSEHDPYVEALQAKLKKRSVGALPAALRDALSLLWAVSPRSTVLIVAAQLAAAVGMGAEVLLTKHALELLLQGQKISATLPIFLALVVLNAVVRSVATIQTQHQALLGELVTRGTWERLLGVTTSVPLLTFEHADFYDRLQRIRSYSLTKPLQLAQGVIGLLGGGLGIVALVLALLSMQPLVLPISLAAAVPLLFLARLGGRIEFEFALAQTQNLRERFAVLDVLTERSSAKEVRAFSLQGFFRRQVRQRLRPIRSCFPAQDSAPYTSAPPCESLQCGCKRRRHHGPAAPHLAQSRIAGSRGSRGGRRDALGRPG